MTAIPLNHYTANPEMNTKNDARKFGLPCRHWSYPVIAVIAGVVALARCASTVSVFNHTTDELAHIAGAVGLYESGRNVYMVEHPTLQRLVVGLALHLVGVDYPPARDLKEVQARPEANAAGAAIVLRGDRPYWKVLAVARRANLIFLAALLFYVYRLGAYLANPLAGMLACVFLSFDANVLGHAGLVTTDLPAAAGFLWATYYGLRFVGRPSWGRATEAAVGLGLAMSCKFTCVLLAPAIVVLILIRSLRGFRQHMPKLRYWLAAPVIAFAALWGTYLLNIGRLADQRLFEEERTWNRIPQWVKEAPVPMPSMGLGVMFMGAIGKTGFPCYFNGRLDFDGHLFYFPEAISIKSPSGLVIALGLSIVACLFAGRRRPILALCIVLPPSLLLLSAMVGRLQIGVRHVLPVIPFIYLFTVFYLHRGRWVWALLGLMAISAVETARVHPDYLAFFNTLAGGPGNGSKYLADSNLDWGQDVARLADYLKASGRRDYTIKVSGVRVAELVKFLGLDPRSRETDPEELRRLPHGLLCLGVNARLGLEDFKKTKDGTVEHGADWSWVKQYPVVKRIGWSIEVYDLDRGAAGR
jgi:hypothetical protein